MELLQVFLWSMVPIVEQKGAIILGINTFGISAPTVFLVSLIGSLVPVPFILLFFNKIFAWMKKYKSFTWINNIIEKKIGKNSAKMDKYKEIALIVFIGIPLPTTGLWTGSAIAAFLKLDFKKSLLCATIGGIISGFIITVLCITFPKLLGL
jgi:uncharacterized membrane protein